MPKTKKDPTKGLKDIRKVRNLKDKRVVLRLTLNVPIQGDRDILNDFRIKRVLPTLQFLRKAGAKTVVLTHLSNPKQSVRPVVRYLNKFIPVGYLPDSDRDRTKLLLARSPRGGIFVLENMRRFRGEKLGSLKLAEGLAELGDIYINEDFAASHREHASITVLPTLMKSYAGPLLFEELRELSKVRAAKGPFVIILGGAKFNTKLGLMKQFIQKADHIYIGGALANSVFREMGYEVGRSLVDDEDLDLVSYARRKKVHLPVDVVVRNGTDVSVKKSSELKSGDKILDAGPKSVEDLRDLVKGAKTILWNGPLGYFEGGFDKATLNLAKMVASNSAKSYVGGGDTIAAIDTLKLFNKFSFVSTGGGAMIDYLADGLLPGVEALKSVKK